MKILLVNNFYYNRGGDCTYLFSLKRLLEKKGHKVSIFSMHHPQNFRSDYSNYFVSYINYAEEVKNKSVYSGLKVLSRSIFSVEARKNMERLIKDESPDVVHLNNIRHHITPSILYPIKKNNIPVIWTLHDYQLICPNISFLANGKICEKCKKRKYFWPPFIKCKKGSFAASSLAAIEHTFQMINSVYDSVDFFIAPSEFVRNKFIEYGFDEKRLICLKHFIDIECSNEESKSGDYILYVGRLSEEKGIKTLIDAVINIKTVKLKIAGEGPLKEKLQSDASLRDHGQIEFLGHKSREDVIELIKNCMFVVVPSEWYEVFGLVILEAFACGKPVIGSRIGAIPELVTDNQTGFTFESGSADDLRSKIVYLEKNPEKRMEMGLAGRTLVTSKFNADRYYQQLMTIYKKAAEKKGVKIN